MKLYKAMIWTSDSEKAGQRVSVLAESLQKAREKLEAQYGKGNVYDLHNEEDAKRPR